MAVTVTSLEGAVAVPEAVTDASICVSVGLGSGGKVKVAFGFGAGGVSEFSGAWVSVGVLDTSSGIGVAVMEALLS